MSDWRNNPELDDQTVAALVGALGSETFAVMKEQFADDLRSLFAAYNDAAASSDPQALRETAHALKGAASNIGLAKLGAFAAELESGAEADPKEFETVFKQSLDRLMEVA